MSNRTPLYCARRALSDAPRVCHFRAKQRFFLHLARLCENCATITQFSHRFFQRAQGTTTMRIIPFIVPARCMRLRSTEIYQLKSERVLFCALRAASRCVTILILFSLAPCYTVFLTLLRHHISLAPSIRSSALFLQIRTPRRPLSDYDSALDCIVDSQFIKLRLLTVAFLTVAPQILDAARTPYTGECDQSNTKRNTTYCPMRSLTFYFFF